MELNSNRRFDDHAAHYGWVYDNCGSYRNEYWDWYFGSLAHTVLLRQSTGRLALVRLEGLTPTEIWSGQISTTEEFDDLMAAHGIKQNVCD